jgi:peroxiredoxin
MIFSTACNECLATLKILDNIQKDYGKQGLQVLGAAGDDSARFLLANFIARYRPSFPIGFWTKEEIIKAADVTKDSHPVVPILLFIDRGGSVRYQYFGDHPFFKEPEKNIRALSFGMMKVAPLAPAKSAAPVAPKQTPPQN